MTEAVDTTGSTMSDPAPIYSDQWTEQNGDSFPLASPGVGEVFMGEFLVHTFPGHRTPTRLRTCGTQTSSNPDQKTRPVTLPTKPFPAKPTAKVTHVVKTTPHDNRRMILETLQIEDLPEVRAPPPNTTSDSDDEIPDLVPISDDSEDDASRNPTIIIGPTPAQQAYIERRTTTSRHVDTRQAEIDIAEENYQGWLRRRQSSHQGTPRRPHRNPNNRVPLGRGRPEEVRTQLRPHPGGFEYLGPPLTVPTTTTPRGRGNRWNNSPRQNNIQSNTSRSHNSRQHSRNNRRQFEQFRNDIE